MLKRTDADLKVISDLRQRGEWGAGDAISPGNKRLVFNVEKMSRVVSSDGGVQEFRDCIRRLVEDYLVKEGFAVRAQEEQKPAVRPSEASA